VVKALAELRQLGRRGVAIGYAEEQKYLAARRLVEKALLLQLRQYLDAGSIELLAKLLKFRLGLGFGQRLRA
jgi:hypothetical protein